MLLWLGLSFSPITNNSASKLLNEDSFIRLVCLRKGFAYISELPIGDVALDKMLKINAILSEQI